MITPEEALSRWFTEVSEFRGPQREVIDRIAAGNSTLLLMPTGGGKSLTYQLPTLMRSGVAIVVSPLIALMREQAERLQGKGFHALSLGGLDSREAQEALRTFPFNQGSGFIFTSPERAETDGYLEYLLRRNRQRIVLFGIDEAHCISQWGHDFRPDYTALPSFLDRAFGRDGWPPVLAMTATLNSASQDEVINDFRMVRDDIVRSDRMVRENLTLRIDAFSDTKEKLRALDQLMEDHRGEKLIVYTHLKHNKAAGTRAVADRLQQAGHLAAAFDADLPLEERDKVLSGFANGEIQVVCATGAFGMGIDIPDIRGVVHFLLPESLEQYYQEVGRAGRDGQPAFGHLLYTPRNATVREDMIRNGEASPEEVKNLWDDLFEAGRSDIRSVTPNLEFQGRDREHALFYALQRIGALEVLARGPSRAKAFKASSPEATAFLSRIGGATRTGLFLAAFRKLSEQPADAYERLFDLYTNGELRLIRSPVNILVFKSSGLSDEQALTISEEVNSRVAKRLADFTDFKILVENGQDIQTALELRFDN